MSRVLFLTVIIIAAAFTSHAQGEGKKNDIGFSARIFNNPAAPFTIMYKRQIKPVFALRVGLALSANSQRTNFSDNITSNTTSSSSIGPSIGAELQKHIEKLTFYGGTDVRAILGWNKSRDFVNNTATTESVGSSTGVNISPFFGLRYNFVEQFYMATEVNLSLSYFENTSTNRSFVTGNSTTNKSYSYSAALQPAVGVFLFYRF